MGPQAIGQGRAAPERRRRLVGRAASFLGLAAVAVLVAGCGQTQPYSHISPRTEEANAIQGLYQIIFWSALVVFVGVQAALVYTALRFRRRGDERPEQVHGNRRLEIAWTVIPAVVLLVIFIPTARLIYERAAAEETADFIIDVYGKQWWWEIHYPNIPADPANPAAGPLITANELRIPEGADVRLNLRSNNVIHSFWVPQLSGKRDVIPGHDNALQFTASTVGEYFGECAEFCGAAHAWMRFKVLVVPQAEFDAWVEAWRQPPAFDAKPETADVAEAPPSFGACLACHRVTGAVPPNFPPLQTGLASDPYSQGSGPNLTLMACRDTIGAGILVNTPENMARWLRETDEVKEGVYMPNYYEQGLINDQQVQELVEYLGSLKPAGGCPERPPLGGVSATPAAE